MAIHKFTGKEIPIWKIVALAGLYIITAKLSSVLAYPGTNALSLWPPSGLALTALILFERKIWPGIFLGAFISNILLTHSLGFHTTAVVMLSGLTAIGNTAEAFIALYFIEKKCKSGNPYTSVRSFSYLLAFAVFLSPLASAIPGTLLFNLFSSTPVNFSNMFLSWWTGDVFGLLLIPPMFLSERIPLSEFRNSRKITELQIIVLLTVIFIFFILPIQMPIEYLCIPLLIWTALRFGTWFTSIQIFIISISAVYITISGRGPFYFPVQAQSYLLLSFYMITIAVTAFFLAILMSESKQKDESLLKTESRFRTLVENAPVGVLITQSKQLLYINPFLSKLTGWKVDNNQPGLGTNNLLVDLDIENLIPTQELANPWSNIREVVIRKTDSVSFPAHILSVPADTKDGKVILTFIQDLTKQKENEQNILISLQEWENTFDAVSDGIALIDTEGRLIRSNHAMTVLLAKTEVEILGEDFKSLLADVNQQDLQDAVNQIQRTLSRVSKEVSKGSQYLSLVFDPLLNRTHELCGMVLIIRDVTERKLNEIILLESQQRLHDIIDFLPDATLAVDAMGNIIAWNKAIEQMTGFLADDMIGKDTREYATALFGSIVATPIDILFNNTQDLQIPFTSIYREYEYVYAETDQCTLKGEKRILFSKASRFFSADGKCIGAIELLRDITAIKKAERALIESESKYRDLVQNANTIIVRWDKLGKIKFINEFGLTFFGFSEAELLEQSMFKTILPLTTDASHDVHPLIDNICNQPEHYEHHVNENRTKDGKTVFVSWHNRVITDENGVLSEVMSVGADITKNRLMEIELKKSETQYRLLFESAHDAILLLDDAQIIDANKAASELFGFSSNELIGRTLLSLSPEVQANGYHSAQLYTERIQKTLSDDSQFFLWKFQVSNGLSFDSEVSLNKIELENRTILLTMIRDITERQLAEAQIQALLQKLQDNTVELEHRVAERTQDLAIAKERAESADRLKSAFLATMSHELRTPLNSIIGFTGILLKELAGPLNPEQTKQLNMAKNSAQHLLALINDVLDISKIEAGEFEVFKKSYNFHESLTFIADTLRPMAEKKGLRFIVRVDKTIPLIFSDKRRVEQILINLINNAIKFTVTGVVSIECKLVHEYIEIKITDTGIGIGEKDLENIFKPFRQIDSGIARVHEGTGLGLSICKALSEKLGGQISVNSRKDAGSIFTVILPLNS